MYDTFTELGVKPEILKAVEDMGFEEPTPIQKAAIPTALTGKDLIGQAQTGTGKTAAFGIPILERIDISGKGPQAVVLSPTRELAIQSAEEINHPADPCTADLRRTGYRAPVQSAQKAPEYHRRDPGPSDGPHEARHHRPVSCANPRARRRR